MVTCRRAGAIKEERVAPAAKVACTRCSGEGRPGSFGESGGKVRLVVMAMCSLAASRYVLLLLPLQQATVLTCFSKSAGHRPVHAVRHTVLPFLSLRETTKAREVSTRSRGVLIVPIALPQSLSAHARTHPVRTHARSQIFAPAGENLGVGVPHPPRLLLADDSLQSGRQVLGRIPALHD